MSALQQEKNSVSTPEDFDSNARKFLSNKLARNILDVAKSLEDYEELMRDKTLSVSEMAVIMAEEGKFDKFTDTILKFEPYVDFQVRDLLKDNVNKNLSRDALIAKVKNRLRECFRDFNLEERPLLSFFVDELAYLMEMGIIKYSVKKDEVKEPMAANIASIRKFLSLLPAEAKKVPATFATAYSRKAKAKHQGLKGELILPTDGEIVLKLKENGEFEWESSIGLSKKPEAKPFEIATIRIEYKIGEEYKSILLNVSMLNAVLCAQGSYVVSLRPIFEEYKAGALYDFLKFKIFEAIEEAIVEGRVKTRYFVEESTEELENRSDTVKESVSKSLGGVIALETKAPKDSIAPKKSKKKPVEGNKRFASLKIDRVDSIIVDLPGVTRVGGTRHKYRYSRMVDGRRVEATVLPFDNKVDVNPNSLADALNKLGARREFLDRL